MEKVKWLILSNFMFSTMFSLTFLAPQAEGQRAIVMALHACLDSSLHASSFKKLLLRNYGLDFYQTSQECSFGGPLSNSFK